MTAIEVALGAPAADLYQGPGRPNVREFDWHHIAETAPTLTATMLRYLDRPVSAAVLGEVGGGNPAWIRWLPHRQPSRDRRRR